MKKLFIFGLLLIGLVLISCAHRSGREKLKWAEDTVEVVTKVEDCVHEVAQKRSVSPLLDCVVNMQDAQLMVKDGYVVLYSLKTHCPVYSALQGNVWMVRCLDARSSSQTMRWMSSIG